ncbi:MAG: LLM class F420-dependent oxidoreductase [Chloroflexota bacterium]
MATERIGLSLPLDGFALDACVALAQHAEDLGYTDIWTSETSSVDAFSLLGAVATRTNTVRLGTGVVPVYTRPPALLAMATATIQGVSRGRFCLGLGSSTEVIVERWMGRDFRRPLAAVRDTVEAVQLALSGSKVSVDGDIARMRDFRLTLPEVDPVPIYVGALGPRMLDLAAEIADGVMLSHVGYRALRAATVAFVAAVEAHGRDAADVDIAQRVGVAIDEDEVPLRESFRREIAGYGRARAYAASFARQGYVNEASAMQAAWADGNGRAAAEAVSDRMVEDLFIFGSADACRRRLEEYCAAGLRTPIVIPISVETDADVRAMRRRAVMEALILMN